MERKVDRFGRGTAVGTPAIGMPAVGTPAAAKPAVVASLVAVLAGALTACGDRGPIDPDRIVAAFDSLATRAAWPGFEGDDVPVAVFDGSRTWLWRHPDPPPDFRRHAGESLLWVREGRHPAVTANTSVELGGFHTAVALADSGRPPPAQVARTLIHEAFHVHQDRRHPGWSPNEVELFTYPVEDSELLRLRRLETMALRRALQPQPPDSLRRVCWLRAWLRLRTARLARLSEGAASYERLAEVREGLARYVEGTAAGDRPPDLPADGYAPEAVRARTYDVGHALAWLLDRTANAWKRRLADGEAGDLEEVVTAAVAGPEPRPCRLTPDESARALEVARADLRTLVRRRAERLRDFERAPGWRLEIVSPEHSPLLAAAFDPQNVEHLGEGRVLHGRWLRLQGGDGNTRVEVLGREVLTEAAGPHPLFTGVRRLLMTGFRSAPEVEELADGLRLRAVGLEAELPRGVLRRAGRSWRIELAAESG